MNIQRLRAAENDFLTRYPKGFADPAIVEIGKKHNVSKLIEQAQAFFAEEAFSNPQQIAENMTKLVGRSSLVSVFEKPKYRDWIRGMTSNERETFAYAFRDILHGDKEYGFDMMVGMLKQARLAKWTLMTILPNYYAPLDEVYVQPTTCKSIINYLQLEGFVYKPTPSFDFYIRYRDQIIEMRKQVDPSLASTNVAFCGFLMMTTRASA